MKILFCLNLQQIGGIETSSLGLLESLSSNKANEYYLLVRNYDPKKLHQYNLNQVTILSCDDVIQASNDIRTINPDIIQLYKSVFFFEAVEMANLKAKKILIYHSNHRGNNFFLIDEADRIVCVSESVQNFLSSEGVKNLITITNGIKIQSIKRCPGQEVVFSHLGRRDEEEKNLIELFSFWSKRKYFLNARLHLFGGDAYEERGDIVFRKFTPSSQALGETDYLLSFSRSEGFGMSIAEALMSKVPVISRRCGGVTDSLNDEEEILFFDDEESFNMVLSKLESGVIHAPSIAAAGAKKILEHFNIDKTVMAYERLYGELNDSNF